MMRFPLVGAVSLCWNASFGTVASFVPVISSQRRLAKPLAQLSGFKNEATIKDDAIATQSTAISSRKLSSFHNFDFKAHWYPVAWARDLPLNKPIQVTVFDVDYVIAKVAEANGKHTVVAMEDRCPHKSAFLSEGRITQSGHFQCAYHGWSFDGTTGSCVEIPQVVTAQGDMPPSLTTRACGTAVPAMMVQDMVWLFPGGTLEEALLAPPPPIVPEMEETGFTTTTIVRDFPIDYSILLENILDPDHGLFAHGVAGFDLYSASRTAPQSIEEELLNNGKGWRITSRVDAVDKLIALNKNRRDDKERKRHDDNDEVPVATSVFTAPNHVYMGRRDRITGNTSFVTAFWICPTGTGRSRFMSAAIGKVPFSIPRWFMHVSLNNFLDQDTHLLATQQRHVLDIEAETVAKMPKEDRMTKSTHVRKNTYVYRSPTERMGARLGAFWDETLNRAPNRISTLLAMSRSGLLQQTPSRQVTLNREEQHLRICPDSQAVVKNCNRVRVVSATIGVGLAALSLVSNGLWSRVADLVTPTIVTRGMGLSLVAWWLAGKLRREFYFKYTEALRDRDLKNIPKVWLDR